ncbi:hypothetical protein E1A91_A07G037600v1 [Gossypium mustelinum]|uniref:Uncharacterized protein n=1 Tax=Gossypium mustelinum TaxID=34275 RepID=A0A5D2YFW4_GOSMU|nr:hypothetical protein E1A91_A07G037600v1 [Gossypium mustelinum]
MPSNGKVNGCWGTLPPYTAFLSSLHQESNQTWRCCFHAFSSRDFIFFSFYIR